MGMNVENCPRCGKLYVKNYRGLCPACIKEVDQQCEKCVKYLKENRKCTIQELSEATGVSVKQITRFIREGRISIVDNPDMFYACDICGAPIRDHTMCESCRQRLSKNMADVQEEEKRKQELQQQEHASYNIKDRLQDRLR